MPAAREFTDAEHLFIITRRKAGDTWHNIASAIGVSTQRLIEEAKAIGAYNITIGGRGGRPTEKCKLEAAGRAPKVKIKRLEDMDRADLGIREGHPIPANHPYALHILNNAQSFEARWGSD